VIAPEEEDETELPFVFAAVIVNVYSVFDCKPVTVTGEVSPVPVYAPGLEVTVYPVIELPPVAFVVNATVAAPLLYALEVPTSVATPIVGDSGIVVANIESDAVDSGDVPAWFVALTLKV
jgi:hypothetical protein